MSKESALASVTVNAPVAPVAGVNEVKPDLSAVNPESQPQAAAEAGGTAAPKEEILSPRMAHLLKKEAELQRQREEHKKALESFNSEKESLRSIHETLKKFEELKRTNPVEAIKLAGLTEQDFLAWANAQQDTRTTEQRAADAAKSEIQRFKDEQATKEREADQKRQKEVLDTFKGNVRAHLDANKESLELCSFYGSSAQELIEETVSQVLSDSGELISIDEAAKLVEGYYEEQVKSMMNLKKFAPKPVEQVKPVEKAVEQTSAPAPKTITNKVAATVASTAVKRPESKEEKRARLMEMLRNGARP